MKTSFGKAVRKGWYVYYKIKVSIFEDLIDDKKVDCNGYGEDFEYKTFDNCYISALSEATAKKYNCLVPGIRTNESLLPICVNLR